MTMTVEARQVDDDKLGRWAWTVIGAHGWARGTGLWVTENGARMAGILAKRDDYGCVLTPEERRLVDHTGLLWP